MSDTTPSICPACKQPLQFGVHIEQGTGRATYVAACRKHQPSFVGRGKNVEEAIKKLSQ